MNAKQKKKKTPVVQSRVDRINAGRTLRDRVPRTSHATWKPQSLSKGRDPIALLEASAEGRVPELVPLRYAEYCGWTLARAHAKSGDAASISGYLGKSDKFDLALEDFALAYADQTERDHEALVKAVRAGRVQACSDDDFLMERGRSSDAGRPPA